MVTSGVLITPRTPIFGALLMEAARCLRQIHNAPITGAPFAEKTRGKIYVTVGTGQYLNEDGTTDTTQNYAYGLIDDPTNTSPISSSSLVDQTIEQRAGTIEAEPPRTLWHVSKNPFEEGKHRGWRLTLMPGQAIAANSLIRFETLAEFIAVRRSTAAGTNPENICSIDGSNQYHFCRLTKWR